MLPVAAHLCLLLAGGTSAILSISGPSRPPATDAEVKAKLWAGQGAAASFPRLTPGLREELLCRCRRWRREHAALNKSFLTAGIGRGLCDGAELRGSTAEPPLPVLLGGDRACCSMMLGHEVSKGRLGLLGSGLGHL